MKYSIVIPCYNESGNLKKLVKLLEKIPKKYKVEFILVENGSTDNSRDVFENELMLNNKHIKSVYVDNNRGYGYGIIQGLKKASGKYVGWIHADLQYNPLDLLPFFDYLDTGDGEFLLLKGKRKNRKLVEHIFTFGMGIFDSLLFGKKMSNVMAVPVIFNKELLNYMDYFPEDFCIDIFVYVLALKKQYVVTHLPIYLNNRENGCSSWNTGFTSRVKQSMKMIKGSLLVKRRMKEIFRGENNG